MGHDLAEYIDAKNLKFSSGIKQRLLPRLSAIPDHALEWLVMEHYQFSFANKGLLQSAVACTQRLAEPGVSAELLRNVNEEDGHAPMYKEGMRRVGTDMDERAEFAPTTEFLSRVAELTSREPSRALGALYATETAAIFEHETFFDICKEICARRGETYDGSLIKHFHDIHLDGGVEQGHKDGLRVFVDGTAERLADHGAPIDRHELTHGALAAIEAMDVWWNALLEQIDHIAATAETRS